MIVHEWNVRAFKLIFLNLFHSFFIFLRLNEYEMQMSYANTMIGLTNALCNHCAPICYWQTLNYWPRCQSSMNANKMWCKSRFFISDANASWRRCKCKFFSFMMQMSHVGMKMQSLFMMMLVHAFKPWCKCLLIEMEMRMSSNGYVMMQMSLYRNAMTWMSSCRYAINANIPLWVYHDTNALMQTQFIQRFPLFSKRDFLNAWNQNLIYSWKIIFFLT